MENRARVFCAENEALAEYIWKKRQDLARDSKLGTENRDKTIQKAYYNVCNSKDPIATIRDFSKIKGVGKWILKLMQGFFADTSGACTHVDVPKNGEKPKNSRRYMPVKNSVAYALLITLYRETTDGPEFMRKQELIDAAEASGLSRAPVMPEKGKGKPSQFGNSSREWYSGWSSMKTLISKGLVVKSSCPAKYMLTDEGRQAAKDCMSRSNLLDSAPSSEPRNTIPSIERVGPTDAEIICADSDEDARPPSVNPSQTKSSEIIYTDSDEDTRPMSVDPSTTKSLTNIPLEYLKKFTDMGYSLDQILRALDKVYKTSPNQVVSSLWPSVLCCLKEEEIYGSDLGSQWNMEIDYCEVGQFTERASTSDYASLKSCSSYVRVHCFVFGSYLQGEKTFSNRCEARRDVYRMPPLKYWEKFEDVYEVFLVLDNREHFTRSKSKTIIASICKQFKIKIEVRVLPVGDAVWVARHKQLDTEYVLDFIVERKKVDDLRSSIRDNRYKDQKLRLLRSGLKKLMYVVEGDPNCIEGSESIKTACFTTEILERFDVQRTSGLGETLRRYGYLTHAIGCHYNSLSSQDKKPENAGVCPTYDEFTRSCENLEKVTVSDVFATQLMQVQQVTEEGAVAVTDLYPTVASLARAYSLLDGDRKSQEEMLKNQTNNVVNSAGSKNIFELVWG